MDQEILRVFFYDVRCAVVMHFSAWTQFTKMAANGREKTFCVPIFHEGQSFTIVQRQFRTKFVKQPPSGNSIRWRYAQFQETGCVCIPELKVRIRTATETITADMRNELDYRVDVCRLTNGAHIEHL